MKDREKRVAKLQDTLLPHQAYFLANPHDIYYFSGFETLVPEEREAFLLITRTTCSLFYASFSPLPEKSNITTIAGINPQRVQEHLKLILTAQSISELLIDEEHLFVHEYKALQHLNRCQVSALDTKTIWRFRATKSRAEIDLIEQACHISAKAFGTLTKLIKTGMTETEVRDMLESSLRDLGSELPAFPTIVAFGKHSALPHHQPGSTKLEPEMPILLDFGARYQHYRSDMTRTWWHGTHPSPSFMKLEEVVKQAYAAALKQGQPNNSGSISAADIDSSARKVITEAGFGAQFIHTTGHGVGLDIHEPPSLNLNNPTKLTSGMVITIEPGIYLDGQVGYRYENTVVFNETGFTELTLTDGEGGVEY